MNFMKIGRIFAAQRKIINSDRLEVFYNLKQMFYTNNIQERKKAGTLVLHVVSSRTVEGQRP